VTHIICNAHAYSVINMRCYVSLSVRHSLALYQNCWMNRFLALSLYSWRILHRILRWFAVA